MKQKNIRTEMKGIMISLYTEKDKLWSLIWIFTMLLVLLWNYLFLNADAFENIMVAFFNTLAISILSIIFSALWGWSTGVLLSIFNYGKQKYLYLLTAFIVNLVRTIPQIIGLLLGYIFLTFLIQNELLNSLFLQKVFVALVLSVVIFPELSDLVKERIVFYRRTEFYPAMKSCGIKESRIINIEILAKNSLPHILHKLISIFGISIFLLCSIDFIISVGLSTEVSLTNFQITLGSLLAKMDSKQDILAISNLFTDPLYLRHLLFRHLGGISTAFILVFTLISVYKVANGFVKRIQ